ncbi:MAG: aminotransferase class I/II-fold pyridoxal phosphate-dependent enzyme [Oscillospiraceae bacterium]|nr:aminotransferase class I/II-fold pyridoxal phosphate-dependent enzyme [Oscillospiraceae bacterium]
MNEVLTPRHGGNLRYAGELYGGNEKDFIDFSANINPLGTPQLIKNALFDAVENSINNYPDPDCKGLKKALAELHGLRPEFILPGNGASEIFDIAIRRIEMELKRILKVLIPVPAFSGYAAVARDCEVELHYLNEANGFAVDLNDIDVALSGSKKFDILFLGNPNNPASTLLNPVELLEALTPHMQRGLFVIVDEAFIELTFDGEDNSLIRHIAGNPDNYPNLLIARALTKSYALPGVRVGYAVSSSGRIAGMSEMQVEWSVNAFAQSVAPVLGDLGEYRNDTRKWLCSEIPYMFDALGHIRGLKAFRPQTNFILIKIVDDSISLDRVLAGLAERYGILIRDARNFPGLDERFFRVAVKTRKENLLLLGALKSVLTEMV